MKGIIRYFLLGVLVVAMLAACSRPPVQEINDARTAVDSATADGADKYSPAEAGNVNDALTRAMNEARAQDEIFFKNYEKARQMLAQVKKDADALRAGLAVKKQEARKKAVAAEVSAKTSVKDAKAKLIKEIKSKQSTLDIETLSSSIKSLDEPLSDIRKLIATEDYTAAVEKADALMEKASHMSEGSGEGNRTSSLPRHAHRNE